MLKIFTEDTKIDPVLIEAVVRTCSVKKLFSQISENSQESTCAIPPFLIKLQA